MEMSSKTADDKFSCKRRLKMVLIEVDSTLRISTEPYAEALAIGDDQNAIMEEVLNGKHRGT
jgi:kynurenine 3-monooxygenase